MPQLDCQSHQSRLRDNQRRSRARRKEHLDSLEKKYRACELLGVEASTELQAAARKVADEKRAVLNENEELKAMLTERGVSEWEISERLGQKPADCTVAGLSYDYPMYALETLETLLANKKVCKPGAESQEAGECNSSSTVFAAEAQTQLLEPTGKPILQAPEVPMLDMENNYGPSSMPILNGINSIVDSTLQVTRNGLPTGLSAETSSDVSTSSCDFAADIIATMNNVSPDRVKSELGCGASDDCKIHNSALFEMMDRYSGSTLGLQMPV